MKQEDLQKLLDSLDEGPLGNPASYWSNIDNLHLAISPEGIKNRVSNTDWKSLAKKISKTKKGSKLNLNEEQKKNFANRPQVKKNLIAFAKRTEESKKPINAYLAKTMEFVGTYESIHEAARQLNLVAADIVNVLSPRKQQTTKGYTFKYLEDGK